jgi:hypothetical protein
MTVKHGNANEIFIIITTVIITARANLFFPL